MALSDEFKANVKEKLVATLISVKVWVIFVVLALSSIFLCVGLINGKVWAAVNGGIISTVFAMREAFKVAKVRTPDEVVGIERKILP